MTTLLAALLIFAQQKFVAGDPAVLCKDVKEPALCAELIGIRNRDQEVRMRWIADRNNEQIKAEVARTDKEDLARIEEILAKYGWPGPSLVGQAGGSVTWLVIQHADLATQKKYIDMMTKAADAGEIDRALLGTTIDRILDREGKPQLYGTQFREVNGVQVPQPIDDEANVDARRAKMGMTTLAQYAADLGRAYGKPAAVSPVIARVWRGRVPTSRADEYEKYLHDEGVAAIRAIAGNLGAQMLRRTDGDTTEFVVISWWPSRAAIRAFAGDDIGRPHLLPRDKEFLINPADGVQHYEVTADVKP